MKGKRKNSSLKKDEVLRETQHFLTSARNELEKMDYLIYNFFPRDEDNFYSYLSKISR